MSDALEVKQRNRSRYYLIDKEGKVDEFARKNELMSAIKELDDPEETFVIMGKKVDVKVESVEKIIIH